MSTSPAHILVVDDNPATLYSTSRVLRSAGWTISEAETGEQALEKARSGVDLVVLDVNLPDMDGFEVCRRLRADEATARLPVLHLSATFVQDVHKVHGLEAGADGYLTHPIEPPVLIATVNAFLRARQAEIDLRQSEDRFNAVFENALNGVALLDDELRFVNANPAMCQLLQVSREQIVRRSSRDFVPADRQDAISAVDADFRHNGSWRGVFPLQRSNGEVVHLEWNVSVLKKPGLRLAIVSDISERLRFEQEREELLRSECSARADAEHANRLKDEFLATLSHELRTPLNAIVGWSQLLRMGQLDPSEVQDALQTIERNARIQADMIADLLDVSRITSGKIRLEMQSVDAAAVIDAALDSVSPTADAKSIHINKALNSSVSTINADPARLQQVVWNLVNNAVKFTPEGGNITVAMQQEDSQIEIRVSDDGPGISPTLLPQIFDRFRQGDASMSREHGGLGLGLAIVKQLVEMHGGSVRAESPGLGQGATFIVRLPVAGAPDVKPKSVWQEQAPAESRVAQSRPIDLSGVRVLVVEDDPDSRKLLERMISDCRADVHIVDSVSSALDDVDSFRPNVLVSDLGMPRQDGFELIRQLRSRGYNYQNLPAVALTAFARGEDREQALLAGFQIHLAKPVEPRELTAAIAALTGRTG